MFSKINPFARSIIGCGLVSIFSITYLTDFNNKVNKALKKKKK